MATLCCSPSDSRDVRSRIRSTKLTSSSAPTANVWFLGDTRDIRDWKNAPLPQTTGQNVVQDAEMGNEIILLVNDSDKAR